MKLCTIAVLGYLSSLSEAQEVRSLGPYDPRCPPPNSRPPPPPPHASGGGTWIWVCSEGAGWDDDGWKDDGHEVEDWSGDGHGSDDGNDEDDDEDWSGDGQEEPEPEYEEVPKEPLQEEDVEDPYNPIMADSIQEDWAASDSNTGLSNGAIAGVAVAAVAAVALAAMIARRKKNNDEEEEFVELDDEKDSITDDEDVFVGDEIPPEAKTATDEDIEIDESFLRDDIGAINEDDLESV
eukprot:g10194.t1 g10194   contig4:1407054-1407844(+)